MSESEWKDANPVTADLPNKGRSVILLIAGGLALGALGFFGKFFKPVGLAVGVFALFTGIGMIVRSRRQKTKNITGIIITVAGFLLLLSHPRFGYIAGFAGYFIFTGALGLVVFGIAKAIKLSWDLGKRY
jgi:asparagine N-glycosylation enzyme membrane subunit Stt3